MKGLRLALSFVLALTLPLSAQMPPGVPPMTTPAGAILIPNPVFTNVTISGDATIGRVLLGDGTAAAPSLTWSSDTNTGFYWVQNGQVNFSSDGTPLISFLDGATTGLTIAGTRPLSWGSSGISSPDTFLFRDGAANTLALRNGTNAQNLRVYNTINGADSEFGYIGWSGNILRFVGASSGAGSSRNVSVGTDTTSSGSVSLMTGGTNQWTVNSTGNLSDNGTHTITAGSTIAAGNGNATISGPQNKLASILDSTATVGVQTNVGTPSLGTCTGGTLVSGGKNTLFEVTGNTSGSCVVNFGTPIWPIAPLCFVNDETALIAVRISARTTNSITVTGAGSGDAFQVFCMAVVGT